MGERGKVSSGWLFRRKPWTHFVYAGILGAFAITLLILKIGYSDNDRWGWFGWVAPFLIAAAAVNSLLLGLGARKRARERTDL